MNLNPKTYGFVFHDSLGSEGRPEHGACDCSRSTGAFHHSKSIGLWSTGNEGMEKNYSRLYRDYYKDPFLPKLYNYI